MSRFARDSTAGLTAPVRQREAIQLNQQTAYAEGQGDRNRAVTPWTALLSIPRKLPNRKTYMIRRSFGRGGESCCGWKPQPP